MQSANGNKLHIPNSNIELQLPNKFLADLVLSEWSHELCPFTGRLGILVQHNFYEFPMMSSQTSLMYRSSEMLSEPDILRPQVISRLIPYLKTDTLWSCDLPSFLF